ncbi:MAG: hypothetical protein R6V86_04150 [Spirochaetia bacterium]
MNRKPFYQLILPGILTIFLLISLFSACSARQDLELNADGSGSTTVRIDLHPIFVQYLRDLTAGLSSEGTTGSETDASGEDPFRIFDELKIADAFARTDGATLQDFQRRAPGHIELSAVFDNPAEVLPDPQQEGIPRVVSFSSSGGERTLQLTLTSENVNSLYSLVGMEEQQNMLTFGPQPNPLTEEEYLDMMGYALGTYAEAGELERVLKSQNLHIVVQVDGEITSAEGFTLQDGRAEATIPFLRPATLYNPLELSLTWRPH